MMEALENFKRTMRQAMMKADRNPILDPTYLTDTGPKKSLDAQDTAVLHCDPDTSACFVVVDGRRVEIEGFKSYRVSPPTAYDFETYHLVFAHVIRHESSASNIVPVCNVCGALWHNSHICSST